jgi:predicted dehydrogenase
MRIALIGDHPDGHQFARALAAGGHHIAAYCGAMPLVDEFAGIRVTRDVEEVLADPGVEAVIVASKIDIRAEHLRRVLQSERHALCVHPVARSPDSAYEAAMLRGDTGVVLLPLLVDALQPYLLALKELTTKEIPKLGQLRFLVLEHCTPRSVFREPDSAGRSAGLFGWEWLRGIRGDIVDLCAYMEAEELSDDLPIFIGGRFEKGGVFQSIYYPRAPLERQVLYWQGTDGRAEVQVLPGTTPAAKLRWWIKDQPAQEQTWDSIDRWQPLVKVFDAAIDEWRRSPTFSPAGSEPERKSSPIYPSWQDEIRILEIEDAARRSVAHHRTVNLEYPEATEEAGFKGTMTLLGCGLLWGLILLLVLSRWLPWLGWVVIPLIIVFLALQLLRWVVPPGR